MDRNIRKSRVKSSQAIKAFENARRKGLGNIIKDLDFSESNKLYDNLSEDEFEKHIIEEKKKLGINFVNSILYYY